MMNTKIRLIQRLAIVISICCASGVVSPAQNAATSEKELLVGRVIAAVTRFTHGSNVGLLWQEFIFGVESENEPNKIKPVLIAYAFHNSTPDGPLGYVFFDHSRLYELHVQRDLHCDESVRTLSTLKNETLDGAPLPPSPGFSFILGAPKELFEPEMVLPCYVLYRGNYRVIETQRTYGSTGAAGARFASNLVRQRLNEIAPPGHSTDPLIFSAVRFTDFVSIRSDPRDKSLGYFQPSAKTRIQ